MCKLFASILLIAMLAGPALAADVRLAGSAARPTAADGAKMAQEVIGKLGGKPKVWILLGWKSDREMAAQQKLIDEVRGVDSAIPLIGCCMPMKAALVFGVGDPIVNAGPTLIGLTGEGLVFKTGFASFTGPEDLAEAGKILAEQVKPDGGKGVMILMTDAVISHDARFPMPDFYKAMQDVLGPQVIVAGGNAMYGASPVYFDDTLTKRGGLVALTISGGVREIKSIVETGRTPISPVLTITKTMGDMSIAELDGKYWMDLLRQYAGEGLTDKEVQPILDKNGGGWGKISMRYPFALLTEHDRLYVRQSHGLKARDGIFALPSECYPLKVGDHVVFLKTDEDIIKPIEVGMKRLQADMPEGQALFLLFPCQSNGDILKDQKRLIATISSRLPKGAMAMGFLPCGEHASWYEPGLDENVCEARYHQLSYPMSMLTLE